MRVTWPWFTPLQPAHMDLSSKSHWTRLASPAEPIVELLPPEQQVAAHL